MRIAFVSNNTAAPWGGSEELWSQAAVELAHAGHSVLACVHHWRPLPKKIVDLAAQGIRVTPLQHSRADTITDLARRGLKMKHVSLAERTLTRIIAPFQPDLVVVSQMLNFDGLDFMQACHVRNIPCGVIAQAAAEVFWPADAECLALRDAYLKTRGAFFVSQHNRHLTEMQIAAPIPHAAIVRNPFLINYDLPISWPKDDSLYRLACVARLAPGVKGHDMLFQVLAHPKWRARPLSVTCFGQGNLNSLRALAAQLKLTSVQFGGHVGDIREIWHTHHALVLTSRFEGLPLALVEAMLAHRTCIVTPAGGSAEMVENNSNGFVAPNISIQGIDEALERAWARRLDWREFGRRAGESVRQLVPPNPAAEFARRLLQLIPR